MTDSKNPSGPDGRPIDPASTGINSPTPALAKSPTTSTASPPTAPDELGPPPKIESSTGDIYAIADGETRSLDPKYIPMQRVSRSIGGVILCGAGFLIVLTVSLVNGFSWVRAAIGFGVWGLFTTLLSIWVFHWPTVRYRHMSYQVDRKGFRFREGVYWQSSVSIPKTRIQHTDVSQGPIERHFGLSTLVVHTAGTQHASVSLDGLRHETSLKIRDYLLAESKAAAAAYNSSGDGADASGASPTATAAEPIATNKILAQPELASGELSSDPLAPERPMDSGTSAPGGPGTTPSSTPGEDHGN